MAPGATERAFVPTPLLGAPGRPIIAPFQFVLSGIESLRIVSVNSLAGAALRIQVRTVKPDGTFEIHSWDHTPHSDRTTKQEDFPLGTGALLSITVYNVGTPPVVGQTFAALHLIAGQGFAGPALGTLFAGYIGWGQALGWPGSPVMNSTEGGGYIHSLVGTNPAAGVEVGETVPLGARWELVMLAVDLTTSATAGTRRTRLSAWLGVARLFDSAQPGTLGPSSTRTLYWAQGMPLETEISPNANLAGLATSMYLSAGDLLGTDTDGLAAGDNYGAPRIRVREWLEALT